MLLCAFVFTASATVEAFTFLCRVLISSLNEHIPGALWEEGQHQELHQGGDPSQAQQKSPAWTQTLAF